MLSCIRDILQGPYQEQMNEFFDYAHEDQDRIVQVLSEKLIQICEAEASCFYMLDDAKKQLIDLKTKSKSTPEGLITASMISKEICILQNPTEESNYNS